MSKILVTGGAGFIGSNLVDELIRLKHQVVIIDDLSFGKKEYLNPKAKFYKVDICDEKKMAEIFKKEKPEYVFHFAAQISVPDSVNDPIRDNHINMKGALVVLENCWENKVKKIIFPSSAALYGEAKKPALEDGPKTFEAPYAIHKYAFEKHLEVFSGLKKFNYTVLRFANVYGPRQYKGGECGVIAYYTFNIVKGQPLVVMGDGLQTRDFVYVGDVIDACLKAMKYSGNGIFNVSTGKRINLFQLIKAVEKAVGEKVKYVMAPARPGDIRNNCLSPAKAKKYLGWESKVSLPEGLKRTIEWVRGN
jgi:UDP-glucose 4-epimerase